MKYYPPRLSAGIDNRPLPVFLLDLKEHLRIDADNQDRLLIGKIAAATAEVERYIGRAIIAGTYTLTLPRFPSIALDNTVAIKIPNSPLRSIVSIKYLDEDNTLQTLDSANYVMVNADTFHSIHPAVDMSWPTTLAVDDAVRVEYVAGLAASPDEVPADIREAIILRASTRMMITEETGAGGRQPWTMSSDLAVINMLMPYCIIPA